MADKGEDYYKGNEEETKWQGFKKMLWNSETKECLGRTGLSWCKYWDLSDDICEYLTAVLFI